MRTIDIALSCDREQETNLLSDVLWLIRPPRIVVHFESPLDLLLRETISWFDVVKPPNLIIASYYHLFRDLKIIAELKKSPLFQWIPVFLIVNEDITLTRMRFLEFGVADVVRWPRTVAAVDVQIRKWISFVEQPVGINNGRFRFA